MNRSLRWAILERDSFTCRYCGRRAPDVALEVDHVEPRSKGGADSADNLVTACVDCNQGKRTRDSRSALTLADRLRLKDDLIARLADDHNSARNYARDLADQLELAGYAVEQLRYERWARTQPHGEPGSVGEILAGMRR